MQAPSPCRGEAGAPRIALIEFFYAYEWPTWAPAASTIPAPAVWPDGETDRR